MVGDCLLPPPLYFVIFGGPGRKRSTIRTPSRTRGRGLRPRNITPTTGSSEPTVNKRFRNRITKKKYIQNEITLLLHFVKIKKSPIMLAVLNLDKSKKLCSVCSIMPKIMLAQ